MAQELSDKHQIINDFLAVNNIKKERQVVEFESIVEYVELSISDVTTVHMLLDNYYFGNIELYETGKIDTNCVHTGFAVPFMEYQLDNQTLVIKGKASPEKGGKPYTVRITPTD